MSWAYDELKHLRNNFSDFLADAKKLAQSWNTICEMKHVVKWFVKYSFFFFYEIASDHRIGSLTKLFEIKVFNARVDIVISELTTHEIYKPVYYCCTN